MNKINVPMEIKIGGVNKKLNLEISINITDTENNDQPETVKVDMKIQNDKMNKNKRIYDNPQKGQFPVIPPVPMNNTPNSNSEPKQYPKYYSKRNISNILKDDKDTYDFVNSLDLKNMYECKDIELNDLKISISPSPSLTLPLNYFIEQSLTNNVSDLIIYTTDLQFFNNYIVPKDYNKLVANFKRIYENIFESSSKHIPILFVGIDEHNKDIKPLFTLWEDENILNNNNNKPVPSTYNVLTDVFRPNIFNDLECMKNDLMNSSTDNDADTYNKENSDNNPDEDKESIDLDDFIKNLNCNKNLNDIEIINSEDMRILCIPFTEIESLNCSSIGHLFDMVIVKMDNRMFVTRNEILACDNLYKNIYQESNNDIPVVLVEMDKETKKIQKVNYSCR